MSIILLTGGAGGLGRSVTQKLVNSGHTLITTLEPGLKNSITASESPNELFPHELDLTDEAGCRALVEQTVQKHGGIDAAILLVGGFAMGSLVETDYGSIERMVTLNFRTAYQVVRPVFEQMSCQPGGGRFVLIGARPALQASAGQHMVAYALSKGLIIQLSDLINATGKDKNIVSAVFIPSTIDTPGNRHSMPDADPEQWVNPDDFAEVIDFVTFGPGQILREPVLKVYNRS